MSASIDNNTTNSDTINNNDTISYGDFTYDSDNDAKMDLDTIYNSSDNEYTIVKKNDVIASDDSDEIEIQFKNNITQNKECNIYDSDEEDNIDMKINKQYENYNNYHTPPLSPTSNYYQNLNKSLNEKYYNFNKNKNTNIYGNNNNIYGNYSNIYGNNFKFPPIKRKIYTCVMTPVIIKTRTII